MRVVTQIAAGPGVSVEQVSIRAETPRWSDPEAPGGYRLVLVRQGIFRARVGGRELLADPAIAYAGSPRLEQSIAHRVGVADTYTSVLLSEGLMAGLAPLGRTLSTAVPVSGDVGVAHRLLVAGARRSADSFELAERATRLAGLLLAPHSPAGAAARRPATAASRRRLAEAARELLAADPGWPSLTGIASRVGCSPHHLSRVFHRETGMTLTRYRNRLRVLRALDALEAGERDLSALAARLGFADHAHLTRTVTSQCGHPPRDLRRWLAESN